MSENTSMVPASPEQKAQGIDYVLSSSDNEGKYGVDEVIKMADRKPIHDTACQHNQVKLDGDRMGDHVAVGCANPQCPVGWYIPVAEAKAKGLLQ